MEPCIETHKGWHVNLANPEPVSICIDDIAISLSRLARYNGHTSMVWSVASHSLLCVDYARHFLNVDDRLALHVLLHDAHEAYMGDIVSPLKYMPELRDAIKAIEDRLQSAIETAFAIDTPTRDEQQIIKYVDNRVLAVEAHHLMHSKGAHWELDRINKEALDLFDEPVAPEHVCAHFLTRFERCIAGIEKSQQAGADAA